MDRVLIVVPADGRYVQLLRLSTSSMAVLSGFDVEAVEDVKIAVDELFSLMLDLGDGSPIDLAMVTGADGFLDIEATTGSPGEAAGDEPPSMNQRIIGLIAAHHELAHVDGRVHVRLRVAPHGTSSR